MCCVVLVSWPCDRYRLALFPESHMTNYSAVYFEARLTETYETRIEQGYTNQILMISTLAQFITIYVVENVHTKQRLVHNKHHLGGYATPNLLFFYPSSCLLMYFFTYGGSSSVISRNISFSIPSGLWMTEPEGFQCAGIYAFVQRTICFEQIEYQPWHLSSTQISSDDMQGCKILAYNKGIKEVFSANN